jgi:hypothetical protein
MHKSRVLHHQQVLGNCLMRVSRVMDIGPCSHKRKTRRSRARQTRFREARKEFSSRMRSVFMCNLQVADKHRRK